MGTVLKDDRLLCPRLRGTHRLMVVFVMLNKQEGKKGARKILTTRQHQRMQSFVSSELTVGHVKGQYYLGKWLKSAC